METTPITKIGHSVLDVVCAGFRLKQHLFFFFSNLCLLLHTLETQLLHYLPCLPIKDVLFKLFIQYVIFKKILSSNLANCKDFHYSAFRYLAHVGSGAPSPGWSPYLYNGTAVLQLFQSNQKARSGVRRRSSRS